MGRISKYRFVRFLCLCFVILLRNFISEITLFEWPIFEMRLYQGNLQKSETTKIQIALRCLFEIWCIKKFAEKEHFFAKSKNEKTRRRMHVYKLIEVFCLLTEKLCNFLAISLCYHLLFCYSWKNYLFIFWRINTISSALTSMAWNVI